MTDSRAALEEAAHKYFIREVENGDSSYLGESDLVKFAEQESSSLKLLLSAMCKGKAGVNVSSKRLLVINQEHCWGKFPLELDSSGILVLTPEIIEALKNAAIF